jgi:hypothetical protein
MSDLPVPSTATMSSSLWRGLRVPGSPSRRRSDRQPSSGKFLRHQRRPGWRGVSVCACQRLVSGATSAVRVRLGGEVGGAGRRLPLGRGRPCRSAQSFHLPLPRNASDVRRRTSAVIVLHVRGAAHDSRVSVAPLKGDAVPCWSSGKTGIIELLTRAGLHLQTAQRRDILRLMPRDRAGLTVRTISSVVVTKADGPGIRRRTP